MLQMIFPWMFDEIHVLKPFKKVAQILAEKKDWPQLYDIVALNNNKVLGNSLLKQDLTSHLQCKENNWLPNTD